MTLAPAPRPASTARAVIDLDAIAHNVKVLSRAAGTPWMAVVKADAYGHGLVPVARTCLGSGASWLGVAQLAEALHLRDQLDAAGVARPAGAQAPASAQAPRLLSWIVPVLSPQEAAAASSPLRAALAADIDLSVSTRSQLEAVLAAVSAQGASCQDPARVHLKLDTGMSRAGATPDGLADLLTALRAAQDAGQVEVVGLWSHLACADELGSGHTERQLDSFHHGERLVAQAGLRPQVRHLAATGGLLWHPRTRLDLVRVGIGLYGLSPNPQVATSAELGLRPAMRLESELVQVKRIPAGQPVSYGGTWVAPTDRWVGLVPLGYADGLPRAAASRAPVWVAGRLTRVVGRVCMDQVVVDLGPASPASPVSPQASARSRPGNDGENSLYDAAAVSATDKEVAFGARAPAGPGDLVVLWGDPQDTAGIPSADDWGQACDTINYEIVTRLGARVPRTYASAASNSKERL